ncbi:MAG: UDP-N-acetylglucosamine 2-epimerase (non-hydrolyzing) [Sphingomonas sp.]|uniref:non-hydrolyzing UDP-N-acetylglucosamine 2-epimerase n=1 Tax=Sphingomonas sp. TaxID=28214 RepID=UPI0025E628AC|nr:UDP-N-acetylglucosamine 2-epimerase (non-hydrolyzing) [Sphingomonas sp.]MBX3565281.1 UDP-N-acetylglucosamine 2-epimerase (non-hydrolyzing) [Sphingomonas sp.]
MTRILTIFGTRPEAIKLAPVVLALAGDPQIVHATCVSGQHRQMLDAVLEVFGLTPDYDLDIMKPGQSLTHITTAVLEGVGRVIDEFKPDWVIVQGDTTTAMAGALAAFYAKVKVAHVEAGLRTGNIHSPWPEEVNRKLVGQLATVHFPPTEVAADNLRAEGVREEDLLVTGNTVIDALQWVAAKLGSDRSLAAQFEAQFAFLNPTKRLLLVTGHRRENFDGGLERVCRALAEIGKRDDVQIVYPVHLNPNVRKVAWEVLSDSPAVHLIEPQDYLPFIHLMSRASLIITDSGGIQEEAPGLGKPVLVTRDTTERPEAMIAGTARLIGTSAEALIANVVELLDDPQSYAAMAQARNPFGDGQAAGRIGNRIKSESGKMEVVE